MGWREDQREFGNLDGMDFAYEEVEDTGGADGVIHYIASSGHPVYEPIGEGATVFSLDAFFVGEDYLADMDAFRDILNRPQTHQFIHPYRGRFQVALIRPYREINRRTEGGMGRFRFRLVQIDDQRFPLLRDPSLDVVDQVGLMNLALIESYGRRFNLGTFAKQIIGTIGIATALMRNVEGKIQAGMNIAESFGGAVTGFTNQATSLLRKPQDMINSMTGTALGIIGTIATAPDDLPSRNRRAFTTLTQTMREIFGQPRPEAPTLNTPEGALEQENSVQWWLANRISYLGAASQTITQMQFSSSDEVNLFRSEFVQFFDEIAEDTSLDDQMFAEIRQLKSAVVAYLQSIAQELPELTTFETLRSLPALTINYAIYGNNERNLELVDRNKVTHPMFVPPRSLEIVSDG